MLQIKPIPAFQDNYFWLIENGEETWVVDPGDADPVLKTLEPRAQKLTGILITHHHPDHIGGVAELLNPALQIVGPEKNRFELVNTPVSEGDTLRICGVEFKVMEVPGHTLNHLAYYAEPGGQAPVLFCGDTLFAAGCGRLFEGTPEQMYQSLSKFQQLPDNTQIYCAHEYTETNLAFALSVEPGNSQVQQRIEEVAALRAKGIPSIPTSIKSEKATNPFLRTTSEEIIATVASSHSVDKTDPTDIFAYLRKMKDVF